MRVLVCGGRDYNDWEHLDKTLDAWYQTQGTLPRFIVGCAKGADTMAEQWAIMWSIPVERYPAQWEKYGKRAGYLRNRQMLDEGKPDLIIAFPGGRGTEMMKEIARKAGVPVIEA